LTNTLKHAGPAKSEVIIRYKTDAVELEIKDNGKAPPPDVVNDNKGRGLIGMRERVSLHGGEFQAGRLPEGGFIVKVKLPVTGWSK